MMSRILTAPRSPPRYPGAVYMLKKNLIAEILNPATPRGTKARPSASGEHGADYLDQL